jgi:hypothetical protein
VLWIRIDLNADSDPAFDLKADPDPAFDLNAGPDPDPGSQTEPDPHGSGSWSYFKVKKDEFLHEK